MRRAEEWILGDAEGRHFSPSRVRDVVIVRFMLVVTPIVVIYTVLNFVQNNPVLAASNCAIVAILIGSLALLKTGHREAAINLLFLGGTSIEVGALILLLTEQTVSVDSRAFLVPVILTIVIVLVGLYAEKPYQIILVLIVAVIYTFAWSAASHQLFFSLSGMPTDFLALQILAFAIAQFSRRLLSRLERIIAARETLNRQLETLNHSTQQAYAGAVRRFSEFSHDIRSPLTGILNIPAMLMETGLTPEQEHYVRLLDHAHRALRGLMQDYLDTVAADGLTPGWVSSIDVSQVLERIAAPYVDLGREKRIDVVLAVPRIRGRCRMSESELSRALRNILDNAIRYTRHGSIRIGAELRNGNDGDRHFACAAGPFLSILVEDTGIGMSEARLSEVRKGTNGPDSQMEGSTGIGLKSARHLITNRGGMIEIDSLRDRGTNVRILIPFTPDGQRGV